VGVIALDDIGLYSEVFNRTRQIKEVAV